MKRPRIQNPHTNYCWSTLVAFTLSIFCFYSFFLYPYTDSEHSAYAHILHARVVKQAAAQQTSGVLPPVDGIPCQPKMHTGFHIHIHVSIYIAGRAVTLPAHIGINDDTCIYWLHTHTPSGIIHIEAPSPKSYMLGNFLDIWSAHFTSLGYPQQLDQSGWISFVNGQPYHGSIHSIPIIRHALITLCYHSPGIRPDTHYNWGGL